MERGREQRDGPSPSGKSLPWEPWLWPVAATWLALDTCVWWLDPSPNVPTAAAGANLPGWTTGNRVALDLTTLRLRDFSTTGASVPTLVCAPYALHDARVADFAPGHSLIGALLGAGLARLYLTDWRSATPEMKFLSIDSYLADLNVAIDELGPPVDLIGLCQGGWLSLIYAARFPHKVRRLVLAGAPVDIAVASPLSRMVAATPPGVFDALVGSGAGLVQGDHLLRFWSQAPDVADVLQRPLSLDDPSDRALMVRFREWYARTLDLPGTFYLEVVRSIFAENRLAEGRCMALGRRVRLDELALPVFVLAGASDEVVPAEQALATIARLGTPSALIAREIVPARHLGLFMGRHTLTGAWGRVARWLRSDLPERRLYAASG